VLDTITRGNDVTVTHSVAAAAPKRDRGNS
jgi:hypothetical protein